MSGAGLGERWVEVTWAREVVKRDIFALNAARADLAELYLFWCTHAALCPEEPVELWQQTYRIMKGFDAAFKQLPMPRALYEARLQQEGAVEYINAEYWEDRACANHREQCVGHMGEAWRSMGEMHERVGVIWRVASAEWTAEGVDVAGVQEEYTRVWSAAYKSVRAWLGIPDVTGVRRREERGRAGRNKRRADMRDMLGALMRLC